MAARGTGPAPWSTAVPRAAFLVGLALALGLARAAPAAEVGLTADLAEARVDFRLPERPAVGGDARVEVTVVPHPGATAPRAVRARLGMPHHGHWTTLEAAREFAAASALEFEGGPCARGEGESPPPGRLCPEPHFEAMFPMPGRYRLRVWLDYADGRETKTAVDFTVADGAPLDAQVAE